MNRKNKKLAASLCTAAMLLFSLNSCGILEIRDATSELPSEQETSAPVLEQAERHNEVEKSENAESGTGDTETTEETETEQNIEEKRIKVSVAGGIAIDNRINADAAYRANGEKAYSFLTMFAAVYPRIHNTDIALTTLEAPCADTEAYPVTDEGVINMPTEALTAVADLGFDVINMAGTNLNTCGDAGIRSTVTGVCSTEVLQIGAYQDNRDASDVRVYEQDGIKIAFLSFMEESPESTMVIPSLTDPEAVKSSVEYAEMIADIVIASVTWNPADSGKRQEYAGNLADYGVDIIVGSDGSSLGKAEWIENADGGKSLVVYSLGNLIATGTDAESILSGILNLEITEAEGSIVLENVTITPIVTHHTEQNEYQVVELRNYDDAMASLHSVKGLTAEKLKQIVSSVIPAEFLANE